MDLTIGRIRNDQVKYLVTKHHYSGRTPNVKYAWGLYDDGSLVGCIVYSVPASHTLCKGVCGVKYKDSVIELSRLVIITDVRNAASYLIGQSLRKLGNHVIVSYADCNTHVGHVGYVYQATNWIYTGQGNAEPLWVDVNTREVVAFTRRHIDRKARELGYDWDHNASSGEGLEAIPQKGKYRYVTFTGDKVFKEDAKKALRYKKLPYPKGDTARHNSCVMVVGTRYTGKLKSDPLGASHERSECDR
jgi:hypothetical protein